MTARKTITKTVWILSLVSFFMDISSEMLYPIMPVYLKTIGFSVVLIGVLEGFAEATAGLSKGYFGHLSDAKGKRLPFIRLGYLLSAISKPMMAVFTWPIWIFTARTMDRLGKGVRTGARDALLSGEATPETKGTVFGFHRGMDTLGAAIGPILALVYLYFCPGQYHTLFYLAFVPGLLSVFSTFLIKEKHRPTPKDQKVGLLSFLRYIPRSSRSFKRVLIGLLLFTLFNSSDVFLLLMLKYRGFSDVAMIGAYIFYNLVYALFAYPAGRIADKIGLKQMFITGLIIFAVTYFGVAISTDTTVLYGMFFLYGIYAACTEGVSKAWISNVCEKEDVATAIGTYEGLRSVTTVIASSLAGLIWVVVNPQAIFMVTAFAVILICLYFFSVPYSKTAG